MNIEKINELMERAEKRSEKAINDRINYLMNIMIDRTEPTNIDFDSFTMADIEKAIDYMRMTFDYDEESNEFVCYGLNKIAGLSVISNIIFAFNQKTRPVKSPFPFI